MKTKQSRGNHPETIRALTIALSTEPGITQQGLRTMTGLSPNTISYALPRIARVVEGSWPYRYVLRDGEGTEQLNEVANLLVKAQIPIESAWARWARMCLSWPDSIRRLSQSVDPDEIAKNLRTMAVSAAALAQAFESVKDEPDWLERIGGGQQ